MNRIKDVLEEKGIKQIWLSKKLGKSYNMVNSYAQNRSQPSLEDLYKIANILSVDIALLLKRNMYNLTENNSTLCVEEPQLMMFKKENKVFDFEKSSNKIYTNFQSIKRLVLKENINFETEISKFINFLILKDAYYNIENQKKKSVTGFLELIFGKSNLNFNSSIKNIAEIFNLKVTSENVKKIKTFIEKMNLIELFTENPKEVNNVLGQVYEKVINKKELGAYYTSQNTTEYITNNSVIPNLINNWSEQDTKLKKYLEGYKQTNKKSLIENAIIKNNLYSELFLLVEKFDEKHLIETIKNTKIIDISCGSGSFIFSTYKTLNKILAKVENKKNTYNFFDNIFGIDIDKEAISILKFRILLETLSNSDYEITKKSFDNFIVGNSLINNSKSELFKSEKSIFDFNKNLKKIIKKGGFDIVLGNPPYVEYRKIKPIYTIDEFKTEKCNNLYAFILEKNYDILKENGNLGMIVPISYVSTKRMKPVRKLLSDNSKYQFCSSFADRPSCLFNGVHQKLNIILLEKEKKSKSITLYTSNYIHWYKEDKNEIFTNIFYKENNFETSDFIFKTGNEIEVSIINKISFSKNHNILSNTVKTSEFPIWLNMRLCFWNKSFTKSQKSNEYKMFYFKTETDAIIFSALLNSNIFFFYWETISDVWHITLKDLDYFKINFNKLNDYEKTEIVTIYKQLEINLEKNKRKIDSKQTQFEYQHKKDKLLIDKLDMIFKRVFSFTDKELEYIRDYQLKFRLNGELTNYLKKREYERN